MGVFPLGFGMEPEVEAETLKYYLGLREDYIGSPMLSALYGVWAAYAGDPRSVGEAHGGWIWAVLRRPV